MAKNDNLTDFLTDVADAIRAKKGTTDKINPQDFSAEIASIETSSGGGSGWTGHADVEGLKAIGWDDEDIAYYQAHGVNWNEEDDEYHKVSDDNKALYGVLTANNIQTYKDRIVYLPKIDFSGVKSMESKFINCYVMVAIPYLNTINVTSMYSAFQYCWSLVCLPPLDTRNVTNMSYAFNECYSLKHIAPLDTRSITSLISAFAFCKSLVHLPMFDIVNDATLTQMCSSCSSLVSLNLKFTKSAAVNNVFNTCRSLMFLKMGGLKTSIYINFSPLLNKESLLYIINNEAATSAITITLHSYAYERLANDADILEALANHPNVSLAK